jgi:hypothetical protein
MGTESETILEAVAYVVIVCLVLLAIAMTIVPKSFTGTSAGAFAAANAISYSISGLSLADQGSMTRFLNGTYDIEIGLEGGSDKALKNYYVKVTPYKDGKPLNPAETTFIGNVKTGDKPLKIQKAGYVKLTKGYGKPVEIAQTSETSFSQAFCTEPAPEKIREYVTTYSMNDDEQKWVKTIMMAESSFVHCQGSSAGAFGLMQLMGDTARWLGVSDRFDAEQNVKGGIKYYRSLVGRYGRYDDKNILAAANYNCGKIGTLVAVNCEAKGIYSGCWDKMLKSLTEENECQGGTDPQTGKSKQETYKYIMFIQRCSTYYAEHPNCYNAPGQTAECPASSACNRK